MSEEVRAAIKKNWQIFMERGPGLHYDIQAYVLAKDSEHGMVLLGGLGGCGVGTMWFEDTEARRRLPGYADAPENPCGAWWREEATWAEPETTGTDATPATASGA